MTPREEIDLLLNRRPVPTTAPAREHIAAVIARQPELASIDTGTWEAAIAAWSTPLPENREWKRRHHADADRAGRVRWANRHPEPTEDLKQAVEGQVAAARSAWAHLYRAGLATRDAGDLVTDTLWPSTPAEAA